MRCLLVGPGQLAGACEGFWEEGGRERWMFGWNKFRFMEEFIDEFVNVMING